MRLRRFLFSRNDPYSRPGSSKGISKKHSTASASPRYPICFASIFGATLKTILDFSGVCTDKKSETVEALHDILQFLGPVGESIGCVAGEDQPHLINGLATHKVSHKQRKHLVECSSTEVGKHSWLARSGLKDVTMGVTAAVLVAHYVMAATGSDAAEVTANLARCTTNARSLLRTWDLSRASSMSMHKAALGAELRALERAAAAAKAAEKVAAATGLDRMTALHLQLSYMRSAAWPAGSACSSGPAHAAAIAKLASGDSIEQTEAIPCSMPSIPVLQLLRVEQRSDAAERDSGSELSSLASSSAASSIGSEDLTMESSIDPAIERDLALAVARMRSVSSIG